MCGRFISGADEQSWEEYCRILRLPTSSAAPVVGDRAPSQDISTVRVSADGIARECVELRWGLIPRWLRDEKPSLKLINIRSETAQTKFRQDFVRRRCIIPAAGFYEWKMPDVGKKKIKHLIHDTARPLISMAGLWSLWKGPNDEILETCAILTTEPCDVVRPIHNRMPAILPEVALDPWLDGDADVKSLRALLVPYSATTLTAEPDEEARPEPEQGELF